MYLKNLDQTHHDATLANEAQKRQMNAQYDRSVRPRSFNEGDLVLTYDQKDDKLGDGKLESMWHGPCIISHVLERGAYELIYYDRIPLGDPRNRLYLKKYYA